VATVRIAARDVMVAVAMTVVLVVVVAATVVVDPVVMAVTVVPVLSVQKAAIRTLFRLS
jgi:hypothetical protein